MCFKRAALRYAHDKLSGAIVNVVLAGLSLDNPGLRYQ